MKTTYTSDTKDSLLQPQSLKLTNRNSLDSIPNVVEVVCEETRVERATIDASNYHSMVLLEDSVYTKTLRENARLVVQRMSESLQAIRNSLLGSGGATSNEYSETVDDQNTHLSTAADLEAEERQHEEQEERRLRTGAIY